MSPAAAHVLLLAIVALSIVLMLVRPRGIAEVWWVGGGALLLLALRLIPLGVAVSAIRSSVDVVLFLIGMMLLSELAEHHGVFDWISTTAVRAAAGHDASRLFTLVFALGVVVTVALSNDATAVVLTPAVLSAVRKARVPPLPHLFACATVANAASFVLPISNPANLVVFRSGMPPLGRWLALFSLPSVLSIVTTYLVLRFVFRRDLRPRLDTGGKPAAQPLSGPGKLVLVGLVLVVAVLLVTSATGHDLGLATALAAMVVTAAAALRSRSNPLPLFRRLSWSTLLLVAALFVLVEAVQSLGALRYTQAALDWADHLPAAAGVTLTAFTVAISNNLVNNLPLGLLAGATLAASHTHGLLASAVLIAVDLGPNLSVTGSLATILWLIALRREQIEVTAWQFLRVGLLAMPTALVAAVAGLFVQHLLGAR